MVEEEQLQEEDSLNEREKLDAMLLERYEDRSLQPGEPGGEFALFATFKLAHKLMRVECRTLSCSSGQSETQGGFSGRRQMDLRSGKRHTWRVKTVVGRKHPNLSRIQI